MRTTLLWLGAGLALAAFVVLVVVMPRIQRAEARGAARALIDGARLAERQIGATARQAGSLAAAGHGVKLSSRADPKLGRLEWVVADNGVIRGWNRKHAVEIAITPALSGGAISWRCHGFPIDAMPADCGGH